jgi:hypothetical protein
MRRSELEHLLRAAGEIIDERQFIVIGSQSILGKYPDAPEELLRSRVSSVCTLIATDSCNGRKREEFWG